VAHIEWIKIQNFKNHEAGQYAFGSGLTCVTGLNGSGKTNLLDAINLLGLTKSKFQKSDADLLLDGAPYYRLEAQMQEGDTTYNLMIFYEREGKKTLKLNGRVLERLGEHIGRVPIVFVNPDDISLVKGLAEERRRFFDNMLCQADAGYMKALQRCGRVLVQRNALLAQAREQPIDHGVLDAYDAEFAQLNTVLAQARASMVGPFEAHFLDLYGQLAEGCEQPCLHYQSTVLAGPEGGFAAALRQARRADLAAGRSTVGFHRDDYLLEMDGVAVRKFGSQGQQKTFLLALNLAKSLWLESHCGHKPILLLDDIMERLDENRIAGLLRLLKERDLGQAILTEATGERMRHAVQASGQEADTVFIEIGAEAKR